MLPRHLTVALFSLGVAACSGTSLTTTDQPNALTSGASVNVNSTAALEGNWRGSASGLTVEIHMTIAGDSIHATGTYSRADPFTLGCGAASLQKSGNFELAGAKRGDVLTALVKASNGWAPSYSATHIGTDTIAGQFASADRGPCAYTLVRRR